MLVTMEENVRTRRIWRACARNITMISEASVRVVNVALPDDYVEHGNVERAAAGNGH